MRRLVYAFVVRKHKSQDFERWGQYDVEAQAFLPPPGYSPGSNLSFEDSGSLVLLLAWLTLAKKIQLTVYVPDLEIFN